MTEDQGRLVINKMNTKWSKTEADKFVARYGPAWGEDLALRTYTARLLGSEKSLVLHGGGNTSVKGEHKNILGESVPGLYVKASGFDMAMIAPAGHVGVDLEFLRRLKRVPALSDVDMVNAMRTHLFDAKAPTPSIETSVHAFIPGKFVDHTHADAILVLSNQANGEALLREALGEDILILPYVMPGFELAKTVAETLTEASESSCDMRAMVWMHHGIITWGDTARESYERMIECVNMAEQLIEAQSKRTVAQVQKTSQEETMARCARVAPVLRGLLASPSEDEDRPFKRMILRCIVTQDVLDWMDFEGMKELVMTGTLTSDHLIRTKALPMWQDALAFEDEDRLRQQLKNNITQYQTAYQDYLKIHQNNMHAGIAPFDSLPRVVMIPGLGVLCAGADAKDADIVRDITLQTLSAKAAVGAMGGTYQGLSDEHLFDMEYRPMQHAKLRAAEDPPLRRQVAVVTGAAGAIGSGICEGLLEAGCHVLVTDLDGPRLDAQVEALACKFPKKTTKAVMDVTDAASVRAAFRTAVETWGGVDILVINAGLAHVSPLEKMKLEAFQCLEKVNVEGTLLLLQEAGALFRRQGTGGDVVLVSTKNVFAPGAKFGAYSATKAASHQLARIASLEMADLDVRVNMVAPDAVFSHGEQKSGLWQEVGPDRMRARGLDEKGLEDYYQSRNLLKAKITAQHVARAVLYFVTRQTPTTGVTLPVDGGLPDATPR